VWTPTLTNDPARKIVDLPDGLVACDEVEPPAQTDSPGSYLLGRAQFRKWMRRTGAVLTERAVRTPPLSLALAQKVAVLRKAHGMTQKQLADAMGIPRSSIAFMETGRTISIQKYVPLLADIFGVPAELFLTGMAEQDTAMLLTQDEHEFITQYRRLPAELKITVTKAVDKAHERMRRRDVAA